MDITKDTRLIDLLDQYPWLMDEAVRLSDKAKMLDSALGRIFLKKATIADLSKKAGIPEFEIIEKLTALIEAHDVDR